MIKAKYVAIHGHYADAPLSSYGGKFLEVSQVPENDQLINIKCFDGNRKHVASHNIRLGDLVSLVEMFSKPELGWSIK